MNSAQFGEVFDSLPLNVRHAIAVEAPAVGDAFESHIRNVSPQMQQNWNTYLVWDLFSMPEKDRLFRAAVRLRDMGFGIDREIRNYNEKVKV